MVLLILSACKPPKYQPPPTPAPIVTATPSVTPAPLPTPTPTPTIPRKTLDVSQLFNGITLFSKFETPQSEKPASVERNADDSYKIQITFTANLPNPSRTLEELAGNDPKLTEVLSQLTRLVDTARVSPYFAKLYENKIEHLRERLNRLDLLLSRHNFYDCETILELQHPDTGRKALLMQGDMDLNSDGSDGDRNFAIDATSPTFQPQTSYRWAKLTDRPNPVLSLYENKLEGLKQEFSLKGLRPERNRELKRSLDETHRVISELKSKSFLISDADPFIVVPSFMVADNTEAFSPSIGDYAAVIYNGKIYPSIVGDAGPSNKIGEASGRICKELNPRASALSRAVNNIKVSYLVFPGTAERARPARPPPLAGKMQTVPRRNRGHSPGTSRLERHRPPLAYSHSHRNSFCDYNPLCGYNSCSHGSFRDPCSLAIAFTKPITRTNASGSFNGDRAATRWHAFPQSHTCRPSAGLAGRRQPIALFNAFNKRHDSGGPPPASLFPGWHHSRARH